MANVKIKEWRCVKCNFLLKDISIYAPPCICSKCGFDNGKLELKVGGIRILSNG